MKLWSRANLKAALGICVKFTSAHILEAANLMVTPLTPAEFAYLDALQIENWNLTRGPTMDDLWLFIKDKPEHRFGPFEVFLFALQEEWKANPLRPTFEDWEYTPIALKAPPRPWVTLAEFEARAEVLKDSLKDKLTFSY